MGSISAHTRPIESLAAYLDTTTNPPHLVLFTADTMGVIKVWDVVKDSTEGPPIWRSTLRDDLMYHRTRINEIVYGDGHLWSGKKSPTRLRQRLHLTMLLFSPPQLLRMRPFSCMYIRHLHTQDQSQGHSSHTRQRSELSYQFTSTPSWIQTCFLTFLPDLGTASESTISPRLMKRSS
jgi:hypothetical protein